MSMQNAAKEMGQFGVLYARRGGCAVILTDRFRVLFSQYVNLQVTAAASTSA